MHPSKSSLAVIGATMILALGLATLNACRDATSSTDDAAMTGPSNTSQPMLTRPRTSKRLSHPKPPRLDWLNADGSIRHPAWPRIAMNDSGVAALLRRSDSLLSSFTPRSEKTRQLVTLARNIQSAKDTGALRVLTQTAIGEIARVESPIPGTRSDRGGRIVSFRRRGTPFLQLTY